MNRPFAAVSKLALALALVSPGLAQAQPGAPAPGDVAATPAPQPVPIPARRPNVLVWMMDDVGFAQVSSYGGLVETPNIDRVARMGLRYTNYHTAPICSAARASFLTGRMPHSVHIGGHATAGRDLPGYDARIPAGAGTIAANLKSAGYATYALGKWDHLPNADVSPAGPFTHWATGQGFERFYGFMAADTDNWHPNLVSGTDPVPAPQMKDYHLSADLADRALGMIRQRDAAYEKRPFFMYWATGAAHAPHHAPREWIERYRGKFDMGWDKAREAILRRQIAQGMLPRGTRLAPRPPEIPAWDSLGADEKKLFARQMETFAAALSHADAQFGRILDELQERGELDNTIVVITSDNGASAEGGPNGLFNEAAVTGRAGPSVAENLRFFDDWGGPGNFPHYSNGWAVAGDTPLRYYKQTTHEGGTRVPLIVAWPSGIAARGALRAGFAHVSDVAPTLLEAAGVPLVETINDVRQMPLEGSSFARSFAADADDPARAQYVELYGNKGLWLDGWSIVTSHRHRTWDWNTAKTFDEPWELYDLKRDPGQTTDLAARDPERVARMARAFEEQARRYNVYPQHNLNDTAAESAAKAQADLLRRGGVWRYHGVVAHVSSSLAPPLAARGFRYSATMDLPAAPVTGPLFAFGGRHGGIGLYLREGRPVFILTDLGGTSAEVAASEPLGEGSHTLRLEVGRGVPGADRKTDYAVRILAGERVIGEGRLAFDLPLYFGIPETFGVGSDEGSPLFDGYRSGTPFAGRLGETVFAFDTTGSAPKPLH